METQDKPKTLDRKVDSVLLSWNEIFPEPANLKYILQIKDEMVDWPTIYWGRKTQFLVENLHPCTCYSFRLRSKKDDFYSEWVYFKAATVEEPYCVRHMRRAVQFGKTSLIRKIISKRPILLETESKDGKTPLVYVAEKGDLQMVTFLINQGANVNTCTLGNKRTPLMVALFNGHVQIANLLVDRGVDVKMKDVNGLTGAHYAVDSNNLESIKFILEHNFDINERDNKGWTALLRAVIMNVSDVIISQLLRHGADPLLKDRNQFDFYKHCEINNRQDLIQFCKDSKGTN